MRKVLIYLLFTTDICLSEGGSGILVEYVSDYCRLLFDSFYKFNGFRRIKNKQFYNFKIYF